MLLENYRNPVSPTVFFRQAILRDAHLHPASAGPHRLQRQTGRRSRGSRGRGERQLKRRAHRDGSSLASTATRGKNLEPRKTRKARTSEKSQSHQSCPFSFSCLSCFSWLNNPRALPPVGRTWNHGKHKSTSIGKITEPSTSSKAGFSWTLQASRISNQRKQCIAFKRKWRIEKKESFSVMKANELLARHLKAAHSAARESVVRGRDLTQRQRGFLVKAGCLVEVMKGWYL